MNKDRIINKVWNIKVKEKCPKGQRGRSRSKWKQHNRKDVIQKEGHGKKLKRCG
jgi:hypothetical protein